MSNKLCIIDGHSLCYRAYFGTGTMTSPDGRPTNAVYTFARFLFKLLKEKQPTHIVATFDSSGPTFRHEIYQEYKATRPPMPEGLRSQIPLILEMLQKHGIPIFQIQGYEADDIIATVAKQASEKNMDVLVVTSDKDLAQIMSDNIHIFDPKNDAIWDREWLKNKKGLTPEQIVDHLALMGDSSDNIPGVPGIGEKTSQKLLEEYGSVDNLLANVENIKKKKLKENIINFKDQLLLSRKLAKINDEVPIDFDEHKSLYEGGDHQALFEFYTDLGLRKFATDLPKIEDSEPKKYKLIKTEEEYNDVIFKLEKAGFFSLVIVYDSAYKAFESTPIGFAFSQHEREGYYLPIENELGEKKFDINFAIKYLKRLLENKDIQIAAYNLKNIYQILHRHDIEIKCKTFDVEIASYVLNPGRKTYDLEGLSLDYLGHRMSEFKNFIDSKPGQRALKNIPENDISEYVCEQADIIRRLFMRLSKDLKNHNLDELFYNIEMPLVEVLANLEYNGISLDAEVLKKMSRSLKKTLDILSEEIYEEAGEEFKINSPKQLGIILFEKLGLDCQKKTKTGYSTNAEVLTEIQDEHPLPKLILEYRSLEKLRSTYLDALPKQMDPMDQKIHTVYHQTGTETGRLSSSDPNLQNIPIRTEKGRSIRRAFIPSQKDWTFVSADYSQVELRMLAHYCNDNNLCETFANDGDIHTRVAAQLAGVSEDEVTKEMRYAAKTVNFSIIYGKSAPGLASDLHISMQEAADFIKSYFKQFSLVKDFLDTTIANAKECGYVSTIMGRRRFIPELNSPKPPEVNSGRRMAVNTVIQGSAADLIKIAMNKIYCKLKTENLKTRMLLQIHDELLCEVPPDEVEVVKQMIRDEMVNALELKVPLKVDVKQGPNWLEMK